MAALTDLQTRFLMVFVLDGEFDLHKTCRLVGATPRIAHGWFSDPDFQAMKNKIHRQKLAAMGFGPLRVLEDMHFLAHSDISQVTVTDDSGLEGLPRHARVAIKSAEFAIAWDDKGNAKPYLKKVTMHDKTGPLKELAEMYNLPDLVRNGGSAAQDVARRAGGLVVRPPITEEDVSAEEMLR
jgi:hypothetical protein